MFERIGASFRREQVRLSQLVGGFPTILIYSYLFGPERDTPCPGWMQKIDVAKIEAAARGEDVPR